MDDISNQKIKNDFSEEKLRHVCCIFLAIETVFLALLFFGYYGSSTEFINQVKFHGIEFSEVVGYFFLRIVVYGVVVLFTILSMRFRGAYIFHEIMHMVLGPLVTLLLGCEFNLFISGAIVFILFYVRFVIYLILSGKSRKKNVDLIDDDWVK